MKYEDEVYNAITKLGGKKQMTMKFLAKIFKLNAIRTKNVLCKTVNPDLTLKSNIDNIVLLKNRWRLIPALVQEKLKYKEFLKQEKHRLKEIDRIKLADQKQKLKEEKLGIKESTKKLKVIPMMNEPHEYKKMPRIKLIGQYKQ
ncbi:MAG: hypothetical protein V9E90_10395 [Saprospiraceae bacterium]